jgi:hypothetical protein
MKVSQATISRRVTILEETIGVLLFIRTPAGTDSRRVVRLFGRKAVEFRLRIFCEHCHGIAPFGRHGSADNC